MVLQSIYKLGHPYFGGICKLIQIWNGQISIF